MDAGLTIPVWCIFDVPAILSKFPQGGTPDLPTYIGNYQDADAFVSMVAPQPYIGGGAGTSELSILAPAGFKIQFMANTFAQPSTCGVMLMAANPNREDVCEPFKMEAISNISALTANIQKGAQVGQYTGYNIVFQIIDPTNMYAPNYYYWDPMITVAG